VLAYLTKNQPSKSSRKALSTLQRTLQFHAFGYSAAALFLVFLGLIFQDSKHVLWFSSVSIGFFLNATYIGLIPVRFLQLSQQILLFVVTLGGQFVLPQGPASAMLFYVFVSTLLVLSKSLLRGAFLSGLGIGLFFLIPFLGYQYPVETAVPEWCSFLLILCSATVALAFQFSQARHTVVQSMESLEVTEQSIRQEMKEIFNHNRMLREGNVSLERGTLFLKDTLHAEAQSTTKLAEKRDDQKSLTNAIHHDMREPLRGIVSFSQLIRRRLSKRAEAEGVQEYLGFAIDGGQRMAKMLDDLLMYSKNNHSEVPNPIDLMSLVSEVREDLYDLIERSNATIEVEGLPVITGFETQLKQLFQNLLSNALKFRREDVAPKVIIRPSSVQGDASKFCIEIKDNGVGIPANQVKKVFGLFNRAHEGSSYEGSGVGLALCRRIAISHAAALTVESSLEEGTTFFFTLPSSSLVKTIELEQDHVTANHQMQDAHD